MAAYIRGKKWSKADWKQFEEDFDLYKVWRKKAWFDRSLSSIDCDDCGALNDFLSFYQDHRSALQSAGYMAMLQNRYELLYHVTSNEL